MATAIIDKATIASDYKVADLSLAEFGAVVGADSNAVKARLFRARDKLRASLGRYFRIGRETGRVKRA